MRSKLIALKNSPAIGGILLLLAAVLAILFANTPLHHTYEAWLETPLSFTFGEFTLGKSLHHWINDGLMVIFFLLVGMEIKRELIEGHLAERAQAVLPVVAAVGGVVLPALIYLGINAGSPETQHGWAIASATDIAFAVGLLALFGKRLPLSLKVFITAVAVIDDLMAILIIAFFYSGELETYQLYTALTAFAILIAMNLLRVKHLSFYLFVGFFMWLAVLQSGVHATIAGVLLGLTIPLHVEGKRGKPMLKQFEHDLAPLVTYVILPLFAFANSGIPLAGMSPAVLADPVPLGIMLGLFFGKQFGIFAASYALIKTGFARLPEDATWRELYGVCIVGGIGFTMSLFIGMLAFPGTELQNEVRIGVMSGSVLSGLLGYFFLRSTLARRAS